MPTTGLEPVRRFRHWSLKPACLPIPARGRFHTSSPSGRRCSRRDSNPHGVNPHRVLNPARLPIPPPEQRSRHYKRRREGQIHSFKNVLAQAIFHPFSEIVQDKKCPTLQRGMRMLCEYSLAGSISDDGRKEIPAQRTEPAAPQLAGGSMNASNDKSSRTVSDNRSSPVGDRREEHGRR